MDRVPLVFWGGIVATILIASLFGLAVTILLDRRDRQRRERESQRPRRPLTPRDVDDPADYWKRGETFRWSPDTDSDPTEEPSPLDDHP